VIAVRQGVPRHLERPPRRCTLRSDGLDVEISAIITLASCHFPDLDEVGFTGRCKPSNSRYKRRNSRWPRTNDSIKYDIRWIPFDGVQ
jgi:hypothetical protein